MQVTGSIIGDVESRDSSLMTIPQYNWAENQTKKTYSLFLADFDAFEDRCAARTFHKVSPGQKQDHQGHTMDEIVAKTQNLVMSESSRARLTDRRATITIEVNERIDNLLPVLVKRLDTSLLLPHHWVILQGQGGCQRGQLTILCRKGQLQGQC